MGEKLNYLTIPQRTLWYFMSMWSEDFWCCTWYSGLEFYLWEYLMGKHEVHADIQKDIDMLKWLSNRLGGWIIDGEYFVPMDKWLEIYKRSRPDLKPTPQDIQWAIDAYNELTEKDMEPVDR